MGVPMSSESGHAAHQDPEQPGPLAIAAPQAVHVPTSTSFVGSLLYSHRCHVCGDMKVPRPFQTNCGTKAQRTCRKCNRQVCVDCYKQAVADKKAALSQLHGLMCAPCLKAKAFTVVMASSAADIIQRIPRCIPLRGIMHCDAEGLSIWGRICSFVYDNKPTSRQRGGRHLFIAWSRSWASATPMLLEAAPHNPKVVQVSSAIAGRSPPPPSRLHDLNKPKIRLVPQIHMDVLPDDATSSEDGSPVARIPDYSSALEDTSGSIFSALNVNTATTAVPQSALQRGTKHHPIGLATTPQQKTPTACNTSRTSIVSQSPFALKGSVRRPVACGAPSASPLPRCSTTLSAKKDVLAAPQTPRVVGHSPRVPHEHLHSSTHSYLRPTEGSHRRTSVACPSMSPVVTARRMSVVHGAMSTPRPAAVLSPTPQSQQHLAAFGRTDTSTVSPLLFRVPKARATASNENVVQALFH